MTGRKRWGLQIKLRKIDEHDWGVLLAPRFDPFVEEVADGNDSYFVLRSSAFDGISTAEEVRRLAKPLAERCNVRNGGR